MPKPDEFYSNRAKFDDWKMQMAIKLRGNADWFPNEESKLLFSSSLLRGTAQDQIRSYVNPDGSFSLDSYSEFMAILENAFGDPDRKGNAQAKLRNLQQKNLDFSSF